MPSEPIDDETLWGEPDKTASGDNPEIMSAEEIDDAQLAMMLWAGG